jgi:hypothetical protein
MKPQTLYTAIAGLVILTAFGSLAFAYNSLAATNAKTQAENASLRRAPTPAPTAAAPAPIEWMGIVRFESGPPSDLSYPQLRLSAVADPDFTPVVSAYLDQATGTLGMGYLDPVAGWTEKPSGGNAPGAGPLTAGATYRLLLMASSSTADNVLTALLCSADGHDLNSWSWALQRNGKAPLQLPVSTGIEFSGLGHPPLQGDPIQEFSWSGSPSNPRIAWDALGDRICFEVSQ